MKVGKIPLAEIRTMGASSSAIYSFNSFSKLSSLKTV